jgi:ATP-dependent Clp protease adapter protein ClpS
MTGIEILNDNTTPMEFVIGTLVKHLGLEREDAILLMLNIHNNGGLLYPLPTLEKAEHVAAAMTSNALAHGYQLICRSVDANNRCGTVDLTEA